jgi:hypothetical protein
MNTARLLNIMKSKTIKHNLVSDLTFVLLETYLNSISSYIKIWDIKIVMTYLEIESPTYTLNPAYTPNLAWLTTKRP